MRFFKRPIRYEIITQRDTLRRSLEESIQENVELKKKLEAVKTIFDYQCLLSKQRTSP